MVTARRVDLSAFRSDPMPLTLRIAGADLTGAAVTFAAGLYADPRSAPLISQGMTLASVSRDQDGLATSLLVATVSKAILQALPLPGEVGDDIQLAYDIQVDPLPLGDGLTDVETTIIFGTLTIKGSVNA